MQKHLRCVASKLGDLLAAVKGKLRIDPINFICRRQQSFRRAKRQSVTVYETCADTRSYHICLFLGINTGSWDLVSDDLVRQVSRLRTKIIGYVTVHLSILAALAWLSLLFGATLLWGADPLCSAKRPLNQSIGRCCKTGSQPFSTLLQQSIKEGTKNTSFGGVVLLPGCVYIVAQQ